MILFHILFFVVFNLNDCESLDKARNEYHQLTSEKSINQFILLYKNSHCDEIKPYLASAIMQQAQYALSPIKKLRYFNQGKKLLESFIEKNPTNIEARYVRVLVQRESPHFLGYYKDVKTDKGFIKENISKTNIPTSYKKIILANLDKIATDN